MKRNAYVKNQVRIIKKTKARFLSIFCIVFLGASFFAGLRQSPLIMKESMHDYLQTYKWNDLDYIATYGFDKSVVKKVEKVEGVEAVDYGFRFDALMSYDEKANIGMTVYSDDDFTKGVDLPELLKGRYPQKDNECLMDYQYIKKSSLKLNDEVTLENDYDKKEYKIVGIVNDSRYMSNLERGTNSLGDGNNSGFILVLNQGNEHMAVPDELFDLHDQKTFYNDLRIHLKNENHLYEFDDDYDEYVKPINQKIKAILKDYNLDFYNQTKEDALNTHDIYPHHCMSICGVNILENGKPQRWKLEDSYGTRAEFNGYYIMNDNYFDEFVLQAIINKKYLSSEQLELLKQKAIEFEIKDPF